MKSLQLAIALIFSIGAAPALADPMFSFTLTGDGHTFQFTAPNLPPITVHPHDLDFNFTNLPGSVDGVSGYSFSADVALFDVGFSIPGLALSVTPPLPGQAGSFPFGPEYDLNGPAFTTLVSDVPNPDPQCYVFTCNDLLTYAFVPGDYALYGYDPARDQGAYTLDISTLQGTSVTPEPPTLLLALTGLAAVAMPLLRRGLIRSGQ